MEHVFIFQIYIYFKYAYLCFVYFLNINIKILKVHVKSIDYIYFVSALCYFCGEQFIHASQSTKKTVCLHTLQSKSENAPPL